MHSSTKDLEVIIFQFSYFVLFATFVVNCLFRLWLRLCRATLYMVKCFSLLRRGGKDQRFDDHGH